MPSIRELNIEREKARRLERLALARKFGASLGVEGARRYANQKQEQEAAVREDIYRQLLQQKQAAHNARVVAAAEDSLRRGEGMRAAREFSATLAAKATVEDGAWAAEKNLEKARYAVARGADAVVVARESAPASARAGYRAAAQSMEAERSVRLLTAARSAAPFTSLAVPMEEEVAVVTRAMPTKESVEVSTGRFDVERKRQLADQRLALSEQHERTRVRARQVLREKRDAEALEQMEREQEALLKQSMLDHAMRSIRPTASHDHQQQDARRSTHLATKAHREFEATFLSGPWPAGTARQLDPLPCGSGGDDDGEFEVFQRVSVDALLSGAPTIGLPVDQLYAKIVLPADGDDDTDGGEGEPMPNSDAPLPTCTNTTASDEKSAGSTYPNASHIADEHVEEESSVLRDPLPAMPGDGVRLADTSDVPTNAYLEERNRQFLQQLAVLQRRLETAKALTAPIHVNDDVALDSSPSSSHNSSADEGAHTSRASERVGEEAFGDDAAGSRGGARLAMTTDQLRNAIRRMKLSGVHRASDSD